MLKKLVLLVVALFSIATEMRMMVQFGKKGSSSEQLLQTGGDNISNHQSMHKPPTKDDLMRWSELWHA